MLHFILCLVILLVIPCHAELVCDFAPVYDGDIYGSYGIIMRGEFTLEELMNFTASLAEDGLEVIDYNREFIKSWIEVNFTDPDILVKIRTHPDVLFVQGIYEMEPSAANWGQDRVNQRETDLDGNADIPFCSKESCPTVVTPNVFMIDSGIKFSHEEFEGRAKLFFDAFAVEGNAGNDLHGHGTHAAAIVGGKSFGLARNANIWSVRVANKNGQYTSAAIWRGLLSVWKNPKENSVINLSLTSKSSRNDRFGNNIINAIQQFHNIPIVVAAGNNDADAGSYWPANSPNVISVGAADDKDVRAGFSNYGSNVNLFAPGVAIKSAGINGDEEIVEKSGTSVATTYVTGLVARIISQKPWVSVDEIQFKINYHATKGIVLDSLGTSNMVYVCKD